MNKIKRSIAYVLALTMLIGLIPMNVSAAAKIAFQLERAVVYENGTNKGAYTYTLKNVLKGQTVKWSVSGAGKKFVSLKYTKKAVTGKTTSNRITIKTDGNADAKNSKFKLTAKVYSSTGALVATVSTSSKIKIFSNKVKVIGEALGGGILPTGTECMFGTEVTPVNSTDTIKWTVKDSDGLDRSSYISKDGEFKADEPGSYTVTATTYNGSKKRKSASQKMVVEDAVIEVEQTEINEFCMKFTSDVKNRFALDKVLITGDDQSTVLAKEFKINPDGIVCVTTRTNLKNAVVYTVKYGSFSENFVASADVPQTLEILPTQVTVNKWTPIQYKLLDKNGINVTSLYPGKIEYTPVLTNGIMDENNRIIMKTVGASGTIHAVFTPSGDGLENVEKEETVVCVPVTSAGKRNFTITDSEKAPDYSADSYQDQRNIYLETTGFVHFRALDAEGDEIEYDSITYESLDKEALIIRSSGQVVPIKAGPVGVLVIVKRDGVETSYNYEVTVGEVPSLSSIELNQTSIQVSNLANLENRRYIKVSALDQFQKAYELTKEAATFVKPSSTSAPVVSYDAELNRIVINPSSSMQGNYDYQITITSGGKSVSKGFTVSVSNVPVSGTLTYEVELDESTVDVALNRSSTTAEQCSNVRLAKYINNVFAGYQTFSVTSITKDGKYYGSNLTLDGTSTVQTIGSTSKLSLVMRKMTDISAVSCNCLKAQTGTYTIELSHYRSDISANIKETVTVTVKDSTAEVVANVDRTTSSEICSTALELVKNCVSVKRGEITDCSVTGENKPGSQVAVTQKDSYHIKDITVMAETEIANGMKVKEIHKVAVDRTLTNK